MKVLFVFLFFLFDLSSGITLRHRRHQKEKHDRVIEVKTSRHPPGKKLFGSNQWTACPNLQQLDCVAPYCQWSGQCQDPPTCDGQTQDACEQGSNDFCVWHQTHALKSRTAAEGFCVPKARRYEYIRVVNFPIFSGCSWGEDLTKSEWIFKRPSKWEDICRAPNTKIEAMFLLWKAQHDYGITLLGADADDPAILKIMVWPEWNFRSHPDDDPLNSADVLYLKNAITKHLAIKNRKDFYIVPGTIYFGEKLKTKGGPPFPSWTPNRDVCHFRKYDLDPANPTPRWAMWNCMEEFYNGISVEFHCKANECENRAPKEIWGRCAVTDPRFEVVEHRKDLMALSSTAFFSYGTKSDAQITKEIADRFFFTSQVTSLGGVTTGADICLDHTTSNLMKATSPLLDSNPFAQKHHHHAKAFPVDVQIIISNGMSITPTTPDLDTFQPVMPNMKVQENGFVILCDGLYGLEGGQVAQVNSSGGLNPLKLYLHMDLNPFTMDIGEYTALLTFNGKDIRAASWDSKNRAANNPSRAYWYELFAKKIQWALVSDKLSLENLKVPEKVG